MDPSDYDTALARLYVAFDAPRPRHIESCPCCTDPCQLQAILTKPLRALTVDDLDYYLGSAFFTVGGPNDFRYLLPRLFELSADTDWLSSPQMLVGRLPRAEWGNWRRAERDAVVAFLSAWFDRWAVGRGDEEIHRDDVEGLLCGMAAAGVEIAPYLDRLRRPENLGGLVELMEWGEQEKDKPIGFWEAKPQAWRQVRDFLATA